MTKTSDGTYSWFVVSQSFCINSQGQSHLIYASYAQYVKNSSTFLQNWRATSRPIARTNQSQTHKVTVAYHSLASTQTQINKIQIELSGWKHHAGFLGLQNNSQRCIHCQLPSCKVVIQHSVSHFGKAIVCTPIKGAKCFGKPNCRYLLILNFLHG